MQRFHPGDIHNFPEAEVFTKGEMDCRCFLDPERSVQQMGMFVNPGTDDSGREQAME